MNVEAKTCWGIGSLFIGVYCIGGFFLYNMYSSIDFGFHVDWWFVLGIPLMFFIIVTVIAFVAGYVTYKPYNQLVKEK